MTIKPLDRIHPQFTVQVQQNGTVNEMSVKSKAPNFKRLFRLNVN